MDRSGFRSFLCLVKFVFGRERIKKGIVSSTAELLEVEVVLIRGGFDDHTVTVNVSLEPVD